MKRKASTRKTGAVVKRAQQILKSQKADYAKIFREEVRKGGDSRQAAKRAGSKYRSRYGSTGSKRWATALKSAKAFEGR